MRAGPSALILMGAGFGLFRGLRLLSNSARNAAPLRVLQARVDTIHVAVARLSDRMEQLQAQMDQRVITDNMTEPLDLVCGQLERGVAARFEHQTRAVEALRSMVGHTDELLQRVLDGLESLDSERKDAGKNTDCSQPGRPGDLVPASRG